MKDPKANQNVPRYSPSTQPQSQIFVKPESNLNQDSTLQKTEYQPPAIGKRPPANIPNYYDVKHTDQTKSNPAQL